MGSKGNKIIFVIYISIQLLFPQQILPKFKMKSISILIFAAFIMLDESEPPVPVEEVKPVTKGQFLLIELPDRNATQSRCSCCCQSSCCYDPLNCCCTGC